MRIVATYSHRTIKIIPRTKTCPLESLSLSAMKLYQLYRINIYSLGWTYVFHRNKRVHLCKIFSKYLFTCRIRYAYFKKHFLSYLTLQVTFLMKNVRVHANLYRCVVCELFAYSSSSAGTVLFSCCCQLKN